MTRKTCTNEPHVDTVLQSVCPGLFNFGRPGRPKKVTRHRVTKNRLHYVDLENLYGASTALKLILNKIDGIKLTPRTGSVPMARNKMPNTRNSSVCYKVKQLPHHGHKLRARRNTTFINNFVDTSGDDDSNHVKPMRELRSSSRLSIAQVKAAEQDQWDSGRPKRACIKQKRISADERLVVDNKNYFKVEVLRNKLRSSDVINREPEIAVVKKKSQPVSEDSEDDKGLLGKFPFKRLRNTELTQLNNEAENFLFPRKDDSSSEDDTDADGSNTSPVNSKKGDVSVVSSDSSSKTNKNKTEPEEETSMDSMSSETSTSRKKRRLTQAEAFILDNQRYYKFETPGSRLRYQGSYLAPLPSKNNGDYSTNKNSRNKEQQKQQKQHQEEIVKTELDLNELKFSFETVPNTEAWYKTFQRQDNGEEHYACYSTSNPGFYKPFLLPYEMGPLPPLDPRSCLIGYKQMKKHFFGDNGATTSTSYSTSDSCSRDDSTKVDDISSTEDTKSSEDSTLMPELSPEPLFRKNKPGPKPGSRRAFRGGRNPRKSPRQHASTLAILSSLLHQRKRRETQKDLNSSKHNLSAISEEGKELEPPEPEPDYDELAKNIADLFSNCMEEFDAPHDGVDVNLHCKPDAIYALQDVANYEDREGPIVPTTKVNVENNPPPRKPYRKKKKNRTGWPNKNKRTVFRKEGSDSRDGIASSEPDNSTGNSPKVREENEENIEDNNRNNKNRKNVSLSKLSSYIEVTNDKINGDVQVQPSNNKLNGVSENYELNFRTPKRKEHRESSSDNCAEVVIASVGDKIDCVNVGLDEWENAERVLAAKLRSEANDINFQPIVRVQKLDSNAVKRTEKRLQNSPLPRRSRPRRMPASPKSPRMLRRPRGGCYRERYN